MNRTEDDLRTLLQLPVEPEAVDRVMASTVVTPRSAERARTRRPALIGLAAMLAVVLVVGVAVAVVVTRPAQRSAVPPAVGSPDHIPLDALVIGFAPDSGYRVETLTLGTNGQSVVAASVSDQASYARASIAPAGLDTAPPLAGREPVSVGTAIAHWYSPYTPGLAGPRQADVLRWESDGFAFSVQGSNFSDDDTGALAVARALRITAPTPVRLPVAISAWPPGLALTELSSEYVGVPSADTAAWRVQLRVGDRLAVTVAPPGIKGDNSGVGIPIEIDGRTWHWNGSAAVLSWVGSDRVVRIGAYLYTDESFIRQSDAEAIASATTFASSFANESTWFDATSALPS